MQKVELIGYMAVFNGAEFIEQSICSTVEYCNRFIVIEGAWRENLIVNNKARSDDGTIDILYKLKRKYPHIEIYFHNECSQLAQRNRVFDYLKSPVDKWLWLIDHDEVYDSEDIRNIRWSCSMTDKECIRINSLTFINDAKHYVPIAWNRLFYLRANTNYIFYAPNDIAKQVATNYVELSKIDLSKSIKYFHYSYCHCSQRFMEKRKERVFLHGNFKWDLDHNGNVYSDGVNIIEYNGYHPVAMRGHKLFVHD